MVAETLVAVRGVSKRFPGVQAVDDVTLRIEAGQVHALVGENGAGKSTLMKILAGIYAADAGEIRLKGQALVLRNPGDALRHGISMIHQELNLIRQMTVAENLFVGREPTYGWTPIVNRRRLVRRTRRLLDEVGVDLDPNARLARLRVAEMQLVEIVKALSYDADVIIMDEPTSALSEVEAEKLFGVIRGLTSRGKAVIYISHKLDEVFAIADRVTVMRDGRHIVTDDIGRFTKTQLISLMVGRDVEAVFGKTDAVVGEVLLEVEGLCRAGAFSDVSFTVRRGEILGLAGLMGAGRTELAETLFGVQKPDAGRMRMRGRPVVITSPHDAIGHGIALVPEDRKVQGLNLPASVGHNASLANLAAYCLFGQKLRLRREQQAVDAIMNQLNIRATSRRQIVNFLSGGNQQKVVIAKWLLCDPDLLILDEPTRGIDVGAKAEIHRIMSELAARGKAIIMISSELPEVMAMSDRVIVLHEGRVTGQFARNELDQETIMACATGHKREPVIA